MNIIEVYPCIKRSWTQQNLIMCWESNSISFSSMLCKAAYGITSIHIPDCNFPISCTTCQLMWAKRRKFYLLHWATFAKGCHNIFWIDIVKMNITDLARTSKKSIISMPINASHSTDMCRICLQNLLIFEIIYSYTSISSSTCELKWSRCEGKRINRRCILRLIFFFKSMKNISFNWVRQQYLPITPAAC